MFLFIICKEELRFNLKKKKVVDICQVERNLALVIAARSLKVFKHKTGSHDGREASTVHKETLATGY